MKWIQFSIEINIELKVNAILIHFLLNLLRDSGTEIF